ncbi:hypothetical protein EDD16DRAFT_142627 [Pisolithus croceorrhizus]|nr:hypothetical protein EDD16DRAFT_142627 [Pisolithus croceorrhizus]
MTFCLFCGLLPDPSLTVVPWSSWIPTFSSEVFKFQHPFLTFRIPQPVHKSYLPQLERAKLCGDQCVMTCVIFGGIS